MRIKSWQKVSKYIGQELTRLRKEKGYSTVKDVAVRYDLPEIQYWRIEKGKANLTLKSLTRILSIQKVTFEDFFCELKAA